MGLLWDMGYDLATFSEKAQCIIVPRIKATKATTKARYSLDHHRSTEEITTSFSL
jgi:hypothetical protein